ncbi:MAG: putative manganese transporter [Bacteroidales bacterium]|nr:putative manganese transporter [Bacteroidales bacterium]MDD4670406.1 putative manganese transporter [Bacteroidales bacterium]
MNLELVFDVFKNSILITGLVIIMMLMIEYINIQSQGKWFKSLRSSRTRQVFLGAILGMIPGCIGGFAAVSLYTHRLISFGALIAMMIASSGDESFVMLAMIPRDAFILFGILFVLAIVSGLVINFFSKDKNQNNCDEDFEVHLADHHNHHSEDGTCDKSGECPHANFKNLLHPSWQRIVLLLGVTAFIVALAFGMLEHDHAEHASEHAAESHLHGFNILDEYWLNLVFAVLSLFVLYFITTAKEHFIKDHLWNHVIRKHFLSIFCWTFGALLVIQVGLQYLDIEAWTKANIPFMIMLAVLIGIIPESGPHMIFITLFAGGYVPFSVLLASSISQDGHSALPLLAEDKKGFLKAKLLNVAIGLAVGFGCYFLGF